ncbi:MAG: acylphosphatase, partial [Endomicrobia bacterium]|nr:acylphosphatase [Endomicrobiia bacterium]
MKSYRIEIYGKVQSVGFRPFIYNLAKKYNFNGYVKNKTSYVEIMLQTEEEKLQDFLYQIKSNLPYPAQIEKINLCEQTQPDFLYIPAEIKICKDCLEELFNPNNRRYLYPFINCTCCGPRFTIINDLPYDRKNTTMNVFSMCEDCYKEYKNPLNRRFHAQPNA